MAPLFASQGGGSVKGFGRKFGGPSGLYQFTSHMFTNAGVTGRTGPTLSQLRSSYSSVPWAQDSAFLNVVTQGVQEWTVPDTGNYRILVRGGKGGGVNGGLGASMQGDFNLTKGQILKILVGQQGGSSGFSGGGGGGTFVYINANDSFPLIAAGGGGGQSGGTRAGVGGSSSTSGTAGTIGANTGTPGAGGTNGSAGQTFDDTSNCWDSAAGAGWLGNSSTAPQYCGTNQNFAYAPRNGGNGGLKFWAANSGTNEGGFGGGGGGGGVADSSSGDTPSAAVGGGGGGFSGGGNGANDSSSNRGAGGGGGSYNSGSNQSNTAGTNSGNGYVTITKL